MSAAVVPFSPEALRTLLETSRQNNALLGVTGMLLYKDGNFMQAIEGEEAAIRRLHRKIRLNPRHDGLITLLEKPIERRQFSEWSMGFKDLPDKSAHELPGYNDFLDVSLTSAEFATNPSYAQKLLLTFKREDVTSGRFRSGGFGSQGCSGSVVGRDGCPAGREWPRNRRI